MYTSIVQGLERMEMFSNVLLEGGTGRIRWHAPIGSSSSTRQASLESRICPGCEQVSNAAYRRITLGSRSEILRPRTGHCVLVRVRFGGALSGLETQNDDAIGCCACLRGSSRSVS